MRLRDAVGSTATAGPTTTIRPSGQRILCGGPRGVPVVRVRDEIPGQAQARPPQSLAKFQSFSGEQHNHEYGAPRGGQDGTAHPDPHATGVPGHLGQEVPAEDQAGRGPGRRHRWHLPARGPRPGRRRSHPRKARLLVRALRVGAAPRRHPGRPHHLQRRRPAAQAGHQHHQLHRVRHHRGLDGRHPREGPRSRPHPEGRLRHRLRVQHPASEGRLRRRRRCLHLRPDVLHGYLRQDVLHRLQRRRPPWRADGHVRDLAPGREGLHPRKARRRPPAPVQPVAADHRRLHAGRGPGRRLAAGVPGEHQGEGRHRPGGRRPGRLARVAHPQELHRP